MGLLTLYATSGGASGTTLTLNSVGDYSYKSLKGLVNDNGSKSWISGFSIQSGYKVTFYEGLH